MPRSKDLMCCCTVHAGPGSFNSCCFLNNLDNDIIIIIIIILKLRLCCVYGMLGAHVVVQLDTN